jgi:hypothetical protein
MAKRVQLRRGLAAEHNSFTGALGEITIATDTKELRLHDGSTVGGITLAKASDVAGLATTAVATTSSAGLLSATDKLKIDEFISEGTPSRGLINGPRVLKMDAGVIECNGFPIREIGVNSSALLNNYIKSNDTDFVKEIELMSKAGIRFMRTTTGVNHQVDFQTYWDPDNGATVLRKIKTFLDVCYNNGVGVVLSIFQYWHGPADYNGQTITAAYNDSNSATYTWVDGILEAYATALGEHPALAAWEVGEDWNKNAYAGSLPVINNASITTRTVTTAEDNFSIALMNAFYTKFVSYITTYDTSGRLVMSGNSDVHSKDFNDVKNDLLTENAAFNVCCVGKPIKASKQSLRDYSDMKDFAIDMAKKAATVTKGLIITNFGTPIVESYGGYGGVADAYVDNTAVFKNALVGLYRSGIQLAFASNWFRNTSTTQAVNLYFHPFNTENGSYKKYEALKQVLDKMHLQKYIPLSKVESSVVNPRTGQYISVDPAGSAAKATVPDNGLFTAENGFAVSMWLKTNQDGQINRTIFAKTAFDTGAGTGEGFQILFSGTGDPSLMIRWDDSNQTNTGGTLSPLTVADGWRHYVFQFTWTDPAANDYDHKGLMVYENGRLGGVNAGAVGKTWSPSTAQIAFFDTSNGPVGQSYSFVSMKDVVYFNRILTDNEIHNLYYNDALPFDATVAHWEMNGNLLDSSGNSLGAVYETGTVTYESF